MSNISHEYPTIINDGPSTVATQLAGGIATMSSNLEALETKTVEIPEISPEVMATYETKDVDAVYELDCGDDRRATDASRHALNEAGVAPETSAVIRYYGAAVGITRVFGTAVVAQYGEDALRSYAQGSFVDFTKDVVTRVENKNNVKLVVHTGESNEGNPAQFDPNSENGLGCAYAANVGAVANICANNEDHHSLTKEEAPALISTSVQDTVVQRANETFGKYFFGDEYAQVGLTRQDYVELDLPVEVVEGNHAPANETFVVANYTLDKLSNPVTAEQAGLKFYENSVTQVAEMLMKAFPELQLKPEVLFSVMDQDIRATRAALAGGSAADLELRRYGDPKVALDYLNALAA